MAANTTSGASTNNSARSAETLPLNPLTIGLILEPTIVLVVLGNLLVLVSLRCHRSLIVTDVLLFSLSLADFVDGLVPLQMIIFMNYFVQGTWSKAMCDAYVTVVNTLRFASAGTVTIMAVDRTLLIVFPLQYYTTVTISKAKKLVALIWLISVFFGSLPFMIGRSGFKVGHCLYQLSDLGTEYAIVIITISFLMLLAVMSCYVAIKLSSLKFIKRQSDMVEKLATDASKLALVMRVGKTERRKPKSLRISTKKTRPAQGVLEVRRLTVMMAIVIVLYYISWIPLLVNNIVTLIRGKESSRTVVLFTGMLSLLYALFNPFIYGKMNRRYRKGYQHVIASLLGMCGRAPPTWKIVRTSQSTIIGATRSRTESIHRNGQNSIAQPDAPLTTQALGVMAACHEHSGARSNTAFDDDKSTEGAGCVSHGGLSRTKPLGGGDEEPFVYDTYL